ncbi:MAG TPA: YbaY family lipoprotein [Gemmatimonadales bacterium]|nr:YbaY family lipoprotein [Gemmatimonadales bacterium]
MRRQTLILVALLGCQAEGRLSKVAKDAASAGGVTAVASYAIDTVHATVSYTQETLLPSGTHVKVALVDISRADAPATVISAEDRVTTGNQIPFSFALPFVLDQIPLEARLAVRATIEVEGKTVFRSAEVYPVVTQGAPKRVEMMLVPVR